MKKLLFIFVLATLAFTQLFANLGLPAGYVSIYTLKPDTELMPLTVAVGTAPQLLGPANGWGTELTYKLSNYEKLAFKFTYNAADAGKKVVVRFSINGAATARYVTFPAESTSFVYEVDINTLKNTSGVANMGGIVMYNAAAHWSLTEWTAADYCANPVVVDYIALKTIPATAVQVVPLDATQANALPFNQSTTLKAEFTPANATYQAVTWQSANENIATVSATGVVTSKNVAGQVQITATSVSNPALSANYTVTVVEAATLVTGIQLPATSDVKITKQKTLLATVLPSNATNKTITWQSSDPTVATVDATGKVTGLKVGVTNITATTEDGNFSAVSELTVYNYAQIPSNYVSIYTLNYNMEGTNVALSSTTTFPSAVVPAVFTSDANSLLGDAWNWNMANKYVDLSQYSEVAVAVEFKPEDVGKSFEFRYAFSTSTGSVITNRMYTISQLKDVIVIDLLNDPADTDKLKRLGAIKTRNASSGVVSFDVDYVAVRNVATSIEKPVYDADALVNVYNINGQLVRRSVKMGEATIGLARGLYIINNSKVFVTK